jgi:hypothetical protein
MTKFGELLPPFKREFVDPFLVYKSGETWEETGNKTRGGAKYWKESRITWPLQFSLFAKHDQDNHSVLKNCLGNVAQMKLV